MTASRQAVGEPPGVTGGSNSWSSLVADGGVADGGEHVHDVVLVIAKRGWPLNGSAGFGRFATAPGSRPPSASRRAAEG